MNNKLVIVAVLILILFAMLGLPNSITVVGINWCIKNCENDSIPRNINQPSLPPYPRTSSLSVSDALSIDDLKAEQKIIGVGDNVTVYFNITDKIELPYNFTVYWIYNGTRYFGWFNESNSTSSFRAWYSIDQKGEWTVQVLLNWAYQNQTYSKDEIITLEAVK